MNLYKKFFPNQRLRLKILHLLKPIPDSAMIRVQYFIKTGRFLNLKDPARYTEKIQWYKLNYKDERIKACSDKYDVRSYVFSKGLGRILNPLYGVWHSLESFDVLELPQSFMLKATHGSGTNLLVRDKGDYSQDDLRKIVREWLSHDAACVGREWGYKGIKPKIIAEKILPRDKRGDLPDYKFFCFSGKVYCLYVMRDYTDDHARGQLAFFDRDFEPLHVYRKDFRPLVDEVEKPKNFRAMVEIAEILAAEFPHVRVDLYNIDGDIFFGEMTFYNASGYTLFDPDSFDFQLGQRFELKRIS
ncbi:MULTISPECIES: ATP-grasp fold amidoligase family protein [unclassified Marinobacter]|uniref:ATP-grasp fold amidoligase family protein n=1 Tax=unclassified Marinobacter TaxID=83889 RepID=UPI0018F21DF6|nr:MULTISPECIES: ATP-grasp fold amidoligase family protein [unclassified Marinobacter]